MGIHEASLYEAVQKATGENNAEIFNWQATPIVSGTSRASVYRVAIDRTINGQQHSLSLVYKRCDNVEKSGAVLAVDDLSWQREALVYEQGFFTGETGGLRAPTCYAIARITDSEYGLWMEDVGTAWSENWSLERYRLAAYHLGYFNARFIVADNVPQAAWLAQNNWQRDMELAASALASLAENRNDPQVAAMYPEPIASALLALWQQRRQIVARARDLSPISVCHGDASGRNLYDVGDEETVAIDWHYVGLAPLGEDAARCLGSSVHWFYRGRMDEARDLFENIGDGYIEGLRAAGFSGDERAVRYAYRAVVCALYGTHYVHSSRRLKDPQGLEKWAQSNYGCTEEEALDHRRQMAAFFVELAREGELL